MDETERAFYDACIHEGMESDGYAIQAALRGFRRWRSSGPPVQRKRSIPPDGGDWTDYLYNRGYP